MPSESFGRYQALRNKLIEIRDSSGDEGQDLIDDLDALWASANGVIANLEDRLNRAEEGEPSG